LKKRISKPNAKVTHQGSGDMSPEAMMGSVAEQAGDMSPEAMMGSVAEQAGDMSPEAQTQ
jgi:hypothetical protein